jgi:hypothetical protein
MTIQFVRLRQIIRLNVGGANDVGQLGYGDVTNRGSAANQMGTFLPYVDLGSNERVLKVSGNGRSNATTGYKCALLINGKVKCWGLNTWGNLGYGDEIQRGHAANTMGSYLPYVDLGTNILATDIAVGYSQSCALRSDGNVSCWGANTNGNRGDAGGTDIGDEANEMGTNLSTVSFGAGIYPMAISAGMATCALLPDGGMKCWGNNTGTGYILGYGDTVSRTLPSASGNIDLGTVTPTVFIGLWCINVTLCCIGKQ